MTTFKQLSVALAIGAIALPSAFATSGTSAAENERGYTTHAMPSSGITREQVRAELDAFKKNPVSAEGARFVGGEIGWVNTGHGYVRRGGKLVHADGINHNTPLASALVTPQSRAAFSALYSGG